MPKKFVQRYVTFILNKTMGNKSVERAAKQLMDAAAYDATVDSVVGSCDNDTLNEQNADAVGQAVIELDVVVPNAIKPDVVAPDVVVIASRKNWIEGNAVRQLERTAQLTGMQRAVGMPDLHAGKGCPIGAAFLIKDWIYPFLVGNDIGCGMGLWRTGLKTNKLKLEKWAAKLQLDDPWDGDVSAWLERYGLPSDLFLSSMGTIGGGNHFSELQRVDSICDEAACAALGIDKKWLYLMVHSGSRGLGHEILRAHVEQFRDQGLRARSTEAADYLNRHDRAVRWAVANRALIAQRFLAALRTEGEPVFDLAHNTVTPQVIDGETLWLHRKGAAPSDQGVLVIPGSRGSYSYLVQAREALSHKENAFSLAHGAGRKWMRSEAKPRLAKYRPADFLRTDLGSLVICEDKALMYEEAPQAYKNIDVVIQEMVDAGLIRVLAVLRPVLTYKTRRRQGWREMRLDEREKKQTECQQKNRRKNRQKKNGKWSAGGVKGDEA